MDRKLVSKWGELEFFGSRKNLNSFQVLDVLNRQKPTRAFDRFCAVLTIPIGVFFLPMGAAGLFSGSRAHFDLPPGTVTEVIPCNEDANPLESNWEPGVT